ncbi:MAG: levansucrase [Micromonosporaceae bacterium]|nr:levansucrase [Micromonosporaceae bacterium]
MYRQAATAYLHRLEQVLAGTFIAPRLGDADRCETEWVELDGERVLVGRRSDFRIRWMASRLHLFVIAAARSSVSGPDVEQFTSAAMEYALARLRKEGVPLGWDHGSAVFATLVADQVDASAIAATQRQRNAMACVGRPVVVDAATGRAAYYRGTPVLGLIFAGFLRRKADRYFAAPN